MLACSRCNSSRMHCELGADPMVGCALYMQRLAGIGRNRHAGNILTVHTRLEVRAQATRVGLSTRGQRLCCTSVANSWCRARVARGWLGAWIAWRSLRRCCSRRNVRDGRCRAPAIRSQGSYRRVPWFIALSWTRLRIHARAKLIDQTLGLRRSWLGLSEYTMYI